MKEQTRTEKLDAIWEKFDAAKAAGNKVEADRLQYEAFVIINEIPKNEIKLKMVKVQ